MSTKLQLPSKVKNNYTVQFSAHYPRENIYMQHEKPQKITNHLTKQQKYEYSPWTKNTTPREWTRWRKTDELDEHTATAIYTDEDTNKIKIDIDDYKEDENYLEH